MKQIQRTPEPSPARLTPRQRDAVAQLVAQRNSLVSRLESGSKQIEEMRAAGENVEQWESFWLRLLRQYEQVCDKLRVYESLEMELPQAG